MADNCYELAAGYVLENRDWILVHGYPTLRTEPYSKYGHAWVEFGHLVFDAQLNVLLSREIYYSVGNIEESECKRYSYRETLNKLLKTEQWGPWEDVPEEALFKEG